MKLQPTTLKGLCAALVTAHRDAQKIEAVDLAALNRVLEHKAEDMTATVEAGISFVALQQALAKFGQWLPLDPPRSEKLNIGQLLSTNASGPRRFGYGTIRDYLIGLKVVLADGTLVSSGGKVVKNVAGYDLTKLFIGDHGSLGVIVEATFKLRPLPELEKFVQAKCDSLEQADKLIEAVLNSELTPIVLDLHNQSTAAIAQNASVSLSSPKEERAGERSPSSMQAPLSPALSPLVPRGEREKDAFASRSSVFSPTIVLGFAGTRAEVEWQLAKASELGFKEASSLDYDLQFWNDAAPAQRLSVLPSKIVNASRELKGAPFIARAGNGIIYHRGPSAGRSSDAPVNLTQRLKDAYDPKHIFPDLPL